MPNNQPGYNPNFPRKPSVHYLIYLSVFPMPMFRTNNDINDHNRPVIFVESLPYNQIRYYFTEKNLFSDYMNASLFISVISAIPVNA